MFFGLIILAMAGFFKHIGGRLADSRMSNPVNDLILDTFPAVDFRFIFIYGFVIFNFLIILLVILYPQKIPFMLKTYSLVVIVRGLFVPLTNLGNPPGQLTSKFPGPFGSLQFGGDYFFSGHTAIPFIVLLVFWGIPWVRYSMFVVTPILASTTLLTKLHYSIDVFAAFFIVHSLYVICTKIFKEDYELSRSADADIM